MKSIYSIFIKIISPRSEVMSLVDNQKLSLTTKNIQMQPLVEEKKVLEHTLVYLEKIKNTDYKGLCQGG